MSEFVISVSQNECAPIIGPDSEVCMSSSTVKNIKKYLETVVDKEIHTAKDVIDVAKEVTNCDSELCVAKNKKIQRAAPEAAREAETNFKNVGPANSVQWLNNENIDKCLELWRAKFPKFFHMEYKMRDTAGRAVSKLNWAEIVKRYNFMACALNTDTSGGSGEHWVSFVVDIKGRTVEYFDSAGQTPHDEFVELVVQTANALSAIGPHKFQDVLVTSVEHQKGNTECGVYTLYYILSRLNGVSYKEFEFKRVPDELMIKFRKYIFHT